MAVFEMAKDWKQPGCPPTGGHKWDLHDHKKEWGKSLLTDRKWPLEYAVR